MGVNVPAASYRENDDPCRWTTSTVVHILERQEYLGRAVNFKTYRKSYKLKKQMKNDPSEWQIFEDTHEAIIDKETFESSWNALSCFKPKRWMVTDSSVFRLFTTTSEPWIFQAKQKKRHSRKSIQLCRIFQRDKIPKSHLL